MVRSLRFVILGALLLGAAGAQAQTKLAPRRTVLPLRARAAAAAGTAATPAAGVKDGLAMTNGRVVLTEQGLANPLTADKKLLSGYTVSPTGLVTSPTGTTTQMADGDVASLTGRVTAKRTLAAQDSLLKVQQYDLKYPGKREKLEKERKEKEKEQAKKDAEAEKAKAKLDKQKKG
ncbi:DUF6799 domain-containing protein [Hymenobacter caeli]|uniref:DUF6799 domain-containing protein n=1 Tax=Hymenobacter caeli TaxID=2735894 RepID=A0ABX2FQH5_9BACT|nr:DUF6799 domain-containing protein [Hymenobacter caeli]NRT18801.1 hypothetical protein [Hymenobacter caeli]